MSVDMFFPLTKQLFKVTRYRKNAKNVWFLIARDKEILQINILNGTIFLFIILRMNC